MSWYGAHHPAMTLAQARARLSAGACRLCVYWFAVFCRNSDHTCARCGLTRDTRFRRRR